MTDSVDVAALLERMQRELEEDRAELARLREEVGRLRSRVVVAAAPPLESAPDGDPDATPSRRRFLGLAAFGLGGAGVAATLGAQPAAAANGTALAVGTSVATSATNLVSTELNFTPAGSNMLDAFRVSDQVGSFGDANAAIHGLTGHKASALAGTHVGSGAAVSAIAKGGTAVSAISENGLGVDISTTGQEAVYAVCTNNTAIYARSDNGSAGVLGTANFGDGVRGASFGPLGTGASDLVAVGNGLISSKPANLASLPPTSGTFAAGDLLHDDTDYWVCVKSGTPGTWRKLQGESTAGALHPITPQRCYDSRKTGGKLQYNKPRSFSVARTVDGAALVPKGATAVTYNLTIIENTGKGYLVLYPFGVARPNSSAINWTVPGASAANASLIKLGGDRQLTIVNGGVRSATHFTVDITGYYR